jgi:hypothetical protein
MCKSLERFLAASMWIDKSLHVVTRPRAQTIAQAFDEKKEEMKISEE